MTVEEVIKYARASEISNTHLQEDTTENTEKLISYINLGLIDLYRRFRFRTEEAIIQIKQSKTLYNLDGTDTDVVRFSGADIGMIFEVHDSIHGRRPINEDYNELSVFTPTFNTLQVPFPVDGSVLNVLYRAEPKTMVNLTDVVPLPNGAIEALLHYIGYRAYLHIDSSVQTENNSYFIRYKSALQDISDLGVVNSDDVTTLSTQDKGFV